MATMAMPQNILYKAPKSRSPRPARQQGNVVSYSPMSRYTALIDSKSQQTSPNPAFYGGGTAIIIDPNTSTRVVDLSSGWTTMSESKIKSLVSDVQDALEECSEESWDGYNAKPLDHQSCEYAINFISSLPNSLSLPNIIPEPTGHLGLEWENEDASISLMLSFNNNGKLSFGYYDENSGEEYFGSVKYKNEVPKNIIQFFKIFM